MTVFSFLGFFLVFPLEQTLVLLNFELLHSLRVKSLGNFTKNEVRGEITEYCYYQTLSINAVRNVWDFSDPFNPLTPNAFIN